MVNNKTSEFFKGVSVQTLVTILMGILQIGTFAMLSRLLTKQEFGYMASISAIVAVFFSIAEAGLGSAIIQNKEESNKQISTAYSLSILSGITFTVLLFLFSPVLARIVADETIVFPLKIMSSLMLLNSLLSIGQSILTRQLKFKKLGYIRIAAYFVSSIASIVLAYIGLGVYAIVAQQLLLSIIQLLCIFSTGIKIPAFKIYKEEVRGVINFGGWLTLGVIFNNLTNEIDKLIMPRLLSVSMLGAYNRPAGFVSTISTQLNGIFDSVLFPLLSKIQDEKRKVVQVYLKCISLLNIFSIVLAAAFYFNARLIIYIFFGSQWMNLVPVLQIISISIIFRVDGRLVDCFFRSLGYVKIGFYLRVIGFFVSLGSLLIGSMHGILGVSFGLVASNILIILMKIFTLNYKMGSSVSLLLGRWSRSWFVILPVLAFTVLYKIILDDTMFFNIVYAALFVIIIFIEAVFFPRYIGKEYVQVIYPRILNILNFKL